MSCHSAPGASAIDRSGGSERHAAARAGGARGFEPPLPSTGTGLARGGWGLGPGELRKLGCRQQAKLWRAELGLDAELLFSDVRSWQRRVLQRPPKARRVLHFTALEAPPSFTRAAIATAGAAAARPPRPGPFARGDAHGRHRQHRLHGHGAQRGAESSRGGSGATSPTRRGAPRLVNHLAATGRRFCSLLGSRTRTPVLP